MNLSYLKIKNLIADSILENLETEECNDKLVLVSERSWLKIRNASAADQAIPENSVYLRNKILFLLQNAKTMLPEGYAFMIIDGYRTMESQLRKFLVRFAHVYMTYPDLSFDEQYAKASKWTAPVWKIVPPHTTGGAVDLTLLKDGKKVDMGTVVCEFNEKTQTISSEITDRQKQNRKILIEAMSYAGFINYPTEWWHWSYGDQYWAAISKTSSIYGIVKKNGN